jgi:hypothetical protein
MDQAYSKIGRKYLIFILRFGLVAAARLPHTV